MKADYDLEPQTAADLAKDSSPPASRESRRTDDSDHKDRISRSDRDRADGDGDRRRRRDGSSERERERDGDKRERRRDGSRERRDDGGRDSKRRRSRSRERDDRGGRDSRDYRDNRDNRDYDRRDYRPRDDNRNRQRGSPVYEGNGRGGNGGGRPRSPSPQISEEEREMRSVFVSQLSARVTDRELYLFFEAQAGKVREARVITDRISRRSKGVGYVEFFELETVSKALALTNTKLLGIPIIVQYTEAEKNRQAMHGASGTPGQAGGLYVGSLNFALTESDIREVFQPFGPVEIVDLHKDVVTGKSKGYAFVQFKEPKDAVTALEKMNNFPLAGREIRVTLVSDRGPSIQRQEPSQLDEGTGGTLNNISRMELMQKLSRSDRPTLDLPQAPMFRPNIPQATTRNVLMKNAFDAEEETEADWDTMLRDDVRGEAEGKYGPVSDIYVLKESAGEIYIRFENVDAATLAVAGLNGRWFGGRQIIAQFVSDSLFDVKK